MNRALPPTRNPSGTAKTGWLHRLTETGKAHRSCQDLSTPDTKPRARYQRRWRAPSRILRARPSVRDRSCRGKPAGELSAGGDAQLAVGPGQVKFDRPGAQEYRPADLGIGPALHDEQGDLQFLGGELLAVLSGAAHGLAAGAQLRSGALAGRLTHRHFVTTGSAAGERRGAGVADWAAMAEPAGRAVTTRTLSAADFAMPIGDRYFEDYRAGAVYEYGYAGVSEAEIVAFARQFDPQPIHVDSGFAATGPFGGLIASGWHTAGILMRLFADHYLSRVASLGSPGIDELRWATPVRPGDSLRLRTTIIETRRSRSKPDRGLVRTRGELLSQHDHSVLSLVAMNLLRLRDLPGGAERPPHGLR
jgi:acyl dehydratase